MEISQYKEQFVSEAKEHIDNINQSLLVLEKDPGNEAVINNLFRSFHTLKGNAATMGFEKFSDLAHHLEDLLERVRSKALSVDAGIIDMLFEGCDTLDKGINLIAEDQGAAIDSASIMGRLTEIMGKQDSATVCKSTASLLSDIGSTTAAKNGKKNLLFIELKFGKDNSLKGAKSQIVMREICNLGMIAKTSPAADDIKACRFENIVEILCATDHGIEDIEKIISKVSGIEDHRVLDIADAASVNIDKKEADKAEIANIQKDAIIKQVQSVKIDVKNLDNLMNLVGELLISKIRLEQMSKRYQDKELDTIISTLTRLTVDIQDEVMKERMIPIGNIFNRFPRMIRDLAKKENKQINLIIEGEGIEFDRTVLDEIGDPLVHLLRNCVDHGIETPEERAKNEKDPVGTVKLTAKKEKNNAIIEIADDGAGIDPIKVKQSCIEKGIITEQEASLMDEKSLLRLVFRPGVSTNKIVTEVSGRGVGMDVVETKVKSLGGNVKLDTHIGEGTTVRLQLPLTLAIISTLLVKVDDARYAIPLATINRTVKIHKKDIRTIQGNKVFLLNEEDVPLAWLSEMLHKSASKDKDMYTVVIIEKDDNKIGLVVDSIVSQQQVLIKSLDELVKGINGIGGATILGDGRVAVILDVATLFD